MTPEPLIASLVSKLNQGLIEPHSPALESQVREVVMEHVKAESSGEPFLIYGNLRMLNLPYAKPVYDEVLGPEDCYRRDAVREGSIVIDVGAFCGEFGIWCAKNKGCHIRMYEPSNNAYVAQSNAILNGGTHFSVFQAAIAKSSAMRPFIYSHEHPAGSLLSYGGEMVKCTTINAAIAGTLAQHGPLPVCIKLDCEGAEREIFDDETWLDQNVYLVLMEFHNKDGQRYREILTRHGFKLEMSDENPEAVRATIYATKI